MKEHRNHRKFARALVMTMMVAGSFSAPSTAGALEVTVGGDEGLVEVELGSGQQGGGEDQTLAPSTPSTQPGSAAPAASPSPRNTKPAPSTESSSGSRRSGDSGESSGGGTRSTSSDNGAAGGGAQAPAAGLSERKSPSERSAERGRAADRGRDAATTVITHSDTTVPLWVIILAGGLGLAALIAFALWLRARGRPAAPSVLESVDPVTGLSSGEEFDRRLDEEMVRARRFDQPLGLMMLDIDGFAKLLRSSDANHVDNALREVADVIRDVTSPTDFLAHIDGGLFAVICPHTAIRGMIDLRRDLERAFREDEHSDWSLDIGVTAMEALDAAPEEMVERARHAVSSRHDGRHLVLVS